MSTITAKAYGGLSGYSPIHVAAIRRRGRELRCMCINGAGGTSHQLMVQRINGNQVNGLVTVGLNDIESGESGVDVSANAFKRGRFVEEKLVYRQNFMIRSYEIGPDKTATMETLMNLLQETALNHMMSSGLSSDGLSSDGFGVTYEMSLRKLIWVVTRINIQVDMYSLWGDVVEIDTWMASSGKNGMRRDWIIRDQRTRNIIARATSNWVTMNRETGKLSKIPEQVREEMRPFYLYRSIIPEICGSNKVDKLTDETAENIKSGLAPRWSDIDVNQHVNNVKYIGWILESVPKEVLEYYNLTSMTLEYRRECQQTDLLESLTNMNPREGKEVPNSCKTAPLRSTHLLRLLKDKMEIVRARAEWRPKIIT